MRLCSPRRRRSLLPCASRPSRGLECYLASTVPRQAFAYTTSAMAHPDLALDRHSDVPLGPQLAWKLRGAVATGALRSGDRLPGVRELADAAGVNVNTV